MTDLLTKEERQTVERARLKIREDEAFDNPNTLESELLAIIDNLSKRGVKKYSEKELQKISDDNLYEIYALRNQEIEDSAIIRAYEIGVYVCACFLGALEEK